MAPCHLDADFLVTALATSGVERQQLRSLVDRGAGSPGRRAADFAIGVTAVARGAVLLTRNAADFEGVLELRTEGAAG